MKNYNYHMMESVCNKLTQKIDDGYITTEQAEEVYELAYYKYMTERLETNIKDHTLAKTMTLYHCSDQDIDIVKANSINMGTRLSKPRLSSFWTKNKDEAIIWGIDHLLNLINYSGWAINTKEKKVYIRNTEFEDKENGSIISAENLLKSIFKKEKLYLYTLKDAPIKKIGVGHVNVDEYTIDEDVKPSKKEKVNYNDISKFLVYIPIDKFNKDLGNSYGNKSKSIAEFLLFRNGRKTMDERRNIYYNALQEWEHGKGNHKMDEEHNRLMPNMKRAKKLKK